MKAIKDFLRPILQPIGKKFNGMELVKSDTLMGGIVLLVAGVLLLAIVATIIAICVVKRKKKKAKAAAHEDTVHEIASSHAIDEKPEPVVAVAESAVEPEPTKEEAVAESAVSVEPEIKEEPVKAEIAEQAEKPAPVKAVKKSTATKKPANRTTKKVNGKWMIVIKKENEYLAALLASNGEVMLTSEIYTTPEGAKNGIATIVRGVENGNFVIYCTKSGDYYFKLKSATNKLLCAGEIYTTKEGCLAAVESVKRFAKDAIIVDEVVEGDKYIEYTPAQVSYEIKKGARGKWKVEQTENGYSARLYANNGQLMLSTEEVKEKKTAVKAIENVKKNSAEGNFIIDKDKFGRFYYKLRNSQKSVICIGEGYDTVDACISALESVRKFSATATVAETPNA